MPESKVSSATPIVIAAVEMGYGHLRAAEALAGALGTRVELADQPPLADAREAVLWDRMRRGYERLSRLSQLPGGRPLRRVLDSLTEIPRLYPYRDQSAASFPVRSLERMAQRGLGRGLARRVKAEGATLITTFYALAIAAAYHGARRVICVVTDSDVNRVWAPRAAAETSIEYCVPTERARRRLRAYGVPRERVHVTGFPLPGRLTGVGDRACLRRTVAARIARLDPEGTFRRQLGGGLFRLLGEPPVGGARQTLHLVYAVGGAGAQAGIAREILASMASPLRGGDVRVTLVAGVRAEVAAQFRGWAAESVLADTPRGAVEVLFASRLDEYFERFNETIADADVLWTKPSELTFFAALGVPLVFAPPVGVHERLNRRWAIQRGAGLKQDAPRFAWQWLQEWLAEGTLAAAALSGYLRLPRDGTAEILSLASAI